ncbi:DUF397 domain-containing protein [Actinoallomurus acaciae]|uniref:DUF397 domain-containing protein n=1 Tax=Actinoallomurus acaciae TaxID=502577 RepID=A0ABV5YIU0_9ACTN
MKTPDLSTAHWRTSEYSGAEGGQCVQVATVSAPDPSTTEPSRSV